MLGSYLCLSLRHSPRTCRLEQRLGVEKVAARAHVMGMRGLVACEQLGQVADAARGGGRWALGGVQGGWVGGRERSGRMGVQGRPGRPRVVGGRRGETSGALRVDDGAALLGAGDGLDGRLGVHAHEQQAACCARAVRAREAVDEHAAARCERLVNKRKERLDEAHDARVAGVDESGPGRGAEAQVLKPVEPLVIQRQVVRAVDNVGDTALLEHRDGLCGGVVADEDAAIGRRIGEEHVHIVVPLAREPACEEAPALRGEVHGGERQSL
eukprot:7389286-Prymnesium_polylepis.1